MLTKNPKAARRVRAPSRTTAKNLNEPDRNWLPIGDALFWFGEMGYIPSHGQWESEMRSLYPFKGDPTSIAHRHPSWSLEVPNEQEASARTLGLTLRLNRSWRPVFTLQGPRSHLRWPEVTKPSANFYDDPVPMRFVSQGGAEILPEHSAAATFHRELAEEIFGHFRHSFVLCLEFGRAHIIARKNSPLAPFERVAWDQWQYFKLDPHPKDEPWRERTETDFCHTRYDSLPSTATGPSGEKLYSIHVVPRNTANIAESDEDTSPEKKLAQWLQELMHQFPDRAPMPRKQLIEQALSQFPGLSERGFERALSRAKEQTGNRSWSNPGRRPKSPQKSPHLK